MRIVISANNGTVTVDGVDHTLDMTKEEHRFKLTQDMKRHLGMLED